MTNKKLFAAISAFNTVINSIPDEYEINYTEGSDNEINAYSDTVDTVIEGIMKLMKTLLKGSYFSLTESPDCILVQVFSNEKEREQSAERIVREVSGITCKSINHKTFLEYSCGEALTPSCYTFDEDENAILFSPHGWN